MSDDLVKRLRESGTRSEVELHEDREEAAARIEQLEREKREAALDALAAHGQANDAYEAQLKVEAKLAEVEKEREEARTGLNTAWADRDMHSKARAASAATVATLTAQVEAMRGALEKLACKCSSNCDWERDDVCPSWIARAVLAEIEGGSSDD